MPEKKPEILAPAGDMNCFFAALAAGADAVYLGLKQFSARMEAENFTLDQLAAMTRLAHAEGRKVYVAMNTLIKPDELNDAFTLVRAMAENAQVDGLIIQDLAMPLLAKLANFKGIMIFSTLTNVSFPAALSSAMKFGAEKVVIPRELSLDEMKLMGEACPENLDLECFIHGALCYCVSGRCYWSSYMGGKSGLRGRCVQPCRRRYDIKPEAKIPQSFLASARFFSCQDLELGVLVKTLLKVPRLVSWKIEGRKKGPHYVYHAVTAYRLLRDYPNDPKTRDMALEILEMSLGRPGVKANFLSQRPVRPMCPDQHTSSGLLVGKITFDQKGQPQLKPRIPLLAKDWLRIGVQDERWHATVPVKRPIPKRGVLSLALQKHKTPPQGTPVYLVDRREQGLESQLAEWQKKIQAFHVKEVNSAKRSLKLPQRSKPARLPDLWVTHSLIDKFFQKNAKPGIWLNKDIIGQPLQNFHSLYFWLPPDIWPDTQKIVQDSLDFVLKKGAVNFVCNAPWQRALFPDRLGKINLIAGPFCNLSNGLAIQALSEAGFSAAFASQELSGKDLLALPAQSCLPLGVVIKGNFPVGISRFGLAQIEAGQVFKSPKGEQFWAADYDDTTWIYPAWPLDLTEKRKELKTAGYSFFAYMWESMPKVPALAPRPGLFNWNTELL